MKVYKSKLERQCPVHSVDSVCEVGSRKAARFTTLLGLLFCLAAGVQTALAQGNSATINGTVTDPSGAAVPDAKVTATNTQTGIAHVQQTEANGRYTIVNLTPGVYDVQASAQGFGSVVRKSQEFLVSTTTTLDFNLKVASVSQTVEVDTAPPVVDTTQSNLNTVIEPKEIPSQASRAGDPTGW
jgi:hypothetical protein